VIENKDAFIEKWNAMTQDENDWKRVTAKRLINHFEESKEITEFDPGLFYKTVEKVTVIDTTKIVVSLFDKMDVECQL